MNFKKGNTYNLKMQINNIDIEDVEKIVVRLNEIQKEWNANQENTDIIYEEDGNFQIILTQEDTLSLQDKVKYEVAIKFNDDTVKRSRVYSAFSLKTLIQEAI